ncbi:MAG: minor capsid protein [Desulfovibrio sp.]|nr:minor capsid protein [Desulfovibrio sp.]
MPNNDDLNLDDARIVADGLPPEDAIRFWRQRANLTWDEAKELSEAARSRAFYVTGLLQQDLVNKVSNALRQALENGETFEDFRKRIPEIIKNQGWKDYRVETIFRTNMQTAYAAGRYAKMTAVKKTRPYWQYIAIMDKRTRPSHAVLHERIYPADHEFWESNYPPNGFRCRCAVRTLSQRQIDSENLEVQKEMPKPQFWTDPATNQQHYVQFPGAEKGFRNNPFKAWASSGDLLPMVRDNLEGLQRNLAASSVRGIVKKGFESWCQNPVGNFPLCVLNEVDAEQIGAKVKVAVLSAETYAKQKAHHPELTAKDYALAQEAVDRGEKWPQNEKNLAFVLNEADGVVVIVKATRVGDELYVTSLRRMSGDDAERERTMRKLRRGK